MRLRQRISRLEAQQGNSEGMSQKEINAAAAAFEGKLVANCPSDPEVIADRTAQWHAMVRPSSPPLQRAVAGFDPVDFDL